MTQAEEKDPEAALQNVRQIWLGPFGPGPQVCLFRRRLVTPKTPRSVRLYLYAETVYHLYVNGRYVQRGPSFHHPHRPPVAEIDLLEHWREGENVLAVLVCARNTATHNNVPTGRAGLVARLRIVQADGSLLDVVTDAAWRATDRTGWRSDVPRRNWALGHVEVFDAAAGPAGWQGCDFDDSHWSPAEEGEVSSGVPGLTWIAPDLPLLAASWRPVERIVGLYEAPVRTFEPCASDARTAYGEHLMGHDWRPATTAALGGRLDGAGGGIRLTGLTPERAVALWTDLGRQTVGQVLLECDCPTAGALDVCWAERLLNDRPAVLLKGTTYADRIHATAGPLRWEPIGFSSGRHVILVARGFTGTLRIRRLGMRATQPAADWAGHFECDDDRLNDIWALCERTVRIGTQEGLMDCPTREQATYIGDGHLTARWIGLLTGDYSHWRHLVRESFARQTHSGLVRSAPFSGMKRSVVDFVLLAAVGARDYLRHTGDLGTIREVLGGCRRVFEWFDARRDDSGLLHVGLEMLATRRTWEWEQRFDPTPTWDRHWAELLAIDHPGLGWHNLGEPGIDRRGVNAAINALYVVALRALADLEDALDTGRGADLRRQADRTGAAAAAAFYNEAESAFADGLLADGLLPQISQQTNTWFLWAGLCDDARAQAVLQRILRDDDPDMARGGPYLWSYLLPVLSRHGLHELALGCVRRLWGRMLDGGATTLWETFSGDELDSWCHPWSAAPVEFLLTEVLGLDPLKLRAGRGTLRPRTDLLGSARGAVRLPTGVATIEWRRDSRGKIALSSNLPDGVELRGPGGRS